MPKKTTNGQTATTSTEAKLKGFIFAFHNCRYYGVERNFEHPATLLIVAYDKKEAQHLFEGAIETWRGFDKFNNFVCVIKSVRRNKNNASRFNEESYKRQYDVVNKNRVAMGLSLL